MVDDDDWQANLLANIHQRLAERKHVMVYCADLRQAQAKGDFLKQYLDDTQLRRISYTIAY